MKEDNENTLNKVLLDVQKEYAQSNKLKDKIIILLIVSMFAGAVVGYSGFVWYESQFETTTTEQIEVGTDGDNANAEYKDVEGNQYNESAVHNEGMEGDN